MGLLLVCIGVQFIATGVVELITTESVVEMIDNAYPDSN